MSDKKTSSTSLRMPSLIGESTTLIKNIFNDPQPLPRKVPDYMRGKGGFWYWTGAMVMTAFLYEALTGLVLLFYYQPSNAYVSTMAFLNNTPYGVVILTSHLYGAYAMIVLMYLHLLRNLFVGAYKKPREIQWLTGIILLLLTIGVGYFGYSMSGDVLSQDAVDVGKGILQAFPISSIGLWLSLVFYGGGSTISLFSRLLGWHIVLAASIGVIFALHFFIAEYNTIMPKVEKGADKAPLVDKESKEYKPWFPYNMVYMSQISFLVMGLIILIPSILAVTPNVPELFSPFPQAAPGTAAAATAILYPPWFLLFIYKEMDFQLSIAVGPFWATVIYAGIPLIYLFLLPVLDRSENLKMQDRTVHVALGISGIAYLIGLSVWGAVDYGIEVAYWAFILFFAGIAIPVYLVTRYITDAVKSGKFKEASLPAMIVLMTLIAVFSFLSGIGITSYLASPDTGNAAIMIVLLVITVLLVVSAIAMILGILPEITWKSDKRMSGSSYTFLGAGYAFCAIALVSVMMVISPYGVYNGSLYGIGLGLLFIIMAAMLRLYRSYVYHE